MHAEVQLPISDGNDLFTTWSSASPIPARQADGEMLNVSCGIYDDVAHESHDYLVDVLSGLYATIDGSRERTGRTPL